MTDMVGREKLIWFIKNHCIIDGVEMDFVTDLGVNNSPINLRDPAVKSAKKLV